LDVFSFFNSGPVPRNSNSLQNSLRRELDIIGLKMKEICLIRSNFTEG
jgi:hypothetical protein